MTNKTEEVKNKQRAGIENVFRTYSLELDDSGQDWIENEGFYYEYARRIVNAGYHCQLKEWG